MENQSNIEIKPDSTDPRTLSPSSTISSPSLPTPPPAKRSTRTKAPLINNNPKIKEGHTSFTMASIQIGNTILGAGIISLPVVVRYLGIVLGVIFIALIGLCTIFSVKVLVIAHENTSKNKYSTIARSALGNKGYLVVAITIIFNNFGLCCAYYRIFGETLVNMIQGFVNSDNYLITNWHNYLYILILWLIMAFVVYIDNFERFEKLSSLGVIGIIIYVIGLFTIFFYKVKYGLLPEFSGWSFLPSGPFVELIANLPTVFLSYSFQFNVFPIYFILKNRTKKEMINATSLAVGFCFAIYVLSGVCCFIMYGNLLEDTTLNMLLIDMQTYKDTSTFLKVVLVITNIGFLCCSTTGIPLMFYSLKKNLFDTIKYYKRKWATGEKANKTQIEMTSKTPFDKNGTQTEELDKTEELCEKEKDLSEITKDIDNTSPQESKEENCPPNPNIEHSNNSISNNTKEDFELSFTIKIISAIILYVLIGVTTIVIPQLKTVRKININL